MKRIKKHKERESIFFSMKIYRRNANAEFEVDNIPLKLLDDIVKNIKNKYG